MRKAYISVIMMETGLLATVDVNSVNDFPGNKETIFVIPQAKQINKIPLKAIETQPSDPIVSLVKMWGRESIPDPIIAAGPAIMISLPLIFSSAYSNFFTFGLLHYRPTQGLVF